MKKIIELAEKYLAHDMDDRNTWSNSWMRENDTMLCELLDAIAHRRKLEQTPITEDWLKEHGFKNEYHGIWTKILRHWKDCDNFSHTIGLSVSSQNIYNTMEGELSLIVNADSKGYLSKSIYSLADLYDAMELCGIKMED